jgi:integrase
MVKPGMDCPRIYELRQPQLPDVPHALHVAVLNQGKYFFTGTWAGIKENNALTKGGLSKIFSKLSKSLNKRIYPHQLRHSFATLVIDKNGDLFTLKELLGHSNIKTTAIYLSATKRKKIEVISKLHLK